MGRSVITPCVSTRIFCGSEASQVALTENIVRVLREVERLGSLYAATKSLHMGYSNTLYSIRDIEAALDAKLLESVCSKGSVLTDEGRALVGLYESMQGEAQNLAERVAAEQVESFACAQPFELAIR